MKKIVAFVFLQAILAFSPNAQGQTYSCTQYFQMTANLASSCLFQWPPLSFSNVTPTAVCCNPPGNPFGEMCAARAPSCGPPPNAANEVCLTCMKALAGHPINLATGNTFVTETDLSVPGLGGGLSLTRTWSSLLPSAQSSYPFMFGARWRSTYEERLVYVSGDGTIKYLRADGSVWSFAVVTVGTPNVYQAAAPANDTTTTLTSGTPSWTLAFKNGETRLFDATSGALLSITDRNGNTTQLAYDTSNRLATVTDPAARHLTFNYPIGSTTLVSSVTTDVGISLAYAYDAQGRLTQVTEPDSTTLSFVYDAQNNIITVKDNEGKVLESHTYDASGRGLTSSRANGVDSLTVTYPQ